MPEYAERPEPSYSSNSSGHQPRALTEEEKEAKRLQEERERAERERWNALSSEEQAAEAKAKEEREQAQLARDIEQIKAEKIADSQEEAERRAKREQEKKKASQPETVSSEPSPEERQRRVLQEQARIGVNRHYSDIKKKYIASVRKRIPDVKQRFMQFENEARKQGVAIGTQTFISELERIFGGIKWGVMGLDDPSPKPSMDADGFGIVEHASKANIVDASNTQIQKSVGANAVNLRADVITIQKALLKLGLLSESAFSQESEAANNSTTPSVEQEQLTQTIAAIHKFQEEVLYWTSPDGNIGGNNSVTLGEMRAEHMDRDYAQRRMADFPIIKTRREEAKAAEEEKQRQEAERKQKEAEARAEAHFKQAQRTKQIIEEPATSENAQRFILQHPDILDLADELKSYVILNPKLVEQVLDETGYTTRDNLVYALLNRLSDAELGAISPALISDMKSALEAWLVSNVSYDKEIKRLNKFKKTSKHSGRYASRQNDLQRREQHAVPQFYSPELLTQSLEALMLGDNNQIPASGTIEVGIFIKGQYLVFFIQVSGGVAVQVGVPDDRTFNAQVNWKVGAKTGVDAKLIKASIGVEHEQSFVNSSFESVRHFSAYFHNELYKLCEQWDADPATLGLDPKGAYWTANKEELTKRHYQEESSKTEGVVSVEAKEIGSLQLKTGRQHSIKNEYLVSNIGGDAKKTGLPEEVKTEQSYTGELVINDVKLSFTYLESEKSEPLGIDIKASYTTSKNNQPSKESKNEILNAIQKIQSTPVGYKQMASVITADLGPAIIDGLIKPKTEDGGPLLVEGAIEQEAHFKIAYARGGWHLQYVRFNMTESLKADVDGGVAGFSISGKITQGLFEILGEKDISYISTLYNEMMYESVDIPERTRVRASLDDSKEARKNASPRDQHKLINKTWGGNVYQPHQNWTDYKDSHKLAIGRIIDNFAQGVKEALKSKEAWRSADVMGVKLTTYFGKFEDALDNKLISNIDGNVKGKELAKSFEQHVLFNKFKEDVAKRMQ